MLFATRVRCPRFFDSQYTKLPETIIEVVYAYLEIASRKLLNKHIYTFGNDTIHCSFSIHLYFRSAYTHSHQAIALCSNTPDKILQLETYPSVRPSFSGKYPYREKLGRTDGYV